MTTLTDRALREPSAGAARSVRRFAVAAGIAFLAAFACYLALVRTHPGQVLENVALDGARSIVPSLRGRSLPSLSEVSVAAFAVALAIVVVVAILRRRPVLALTTGAVMVASVVMVQVLSNVLPRPELVPALAGWTHNDFPSGHVAVATAIGIGAVMLVPTVLRAATTVIATLWVMGMGQAVGVTGWHRLSSVLGATLIVAGFGCVGLVVLARDGRVRRSGTSRLVATLVATLVIGAAAFVLGGDAFALAFVRLLADRGLADDVRAELVFSATTLAGSVAIAATFVVFLWLLRPYELDEPGGAHDVRVAPVDAKP
jgi:hypothetical protein